MRENGKETGKLAEPSDHKLFRAKEKGRKFYRSVPDFPEVSRMLEILC